MVLHGDRTSLKAGGDACAPGFTIYELRFTNYDLQFTNYDLLLFFSVADDLFVGMLVKGSFTVKYGRGVYILHYEEHIAPYLKVHEIT